MQPTGARAFPAEAAVPRQPAVARTDRMERSNSSFYNSKLHLCRHNKLPVLIYKTSVHRILREVTIVLHAIKQLNIPLVEMSGQATPDFCWEHDVAIQMLGSTAGQCRIWTIYTRGLQLEEKERSLAAS